MITLKETWKKFHKWISGMPDGFITIALIITALFGIFVALHAPTEFKILLLAYWWFP